MYVCAFLGSEKFQIHHLKYYLQTCPLHRPSGSGWNRKLRIKAQKWLRGGCSPQKGLEGIDELTVE